MRFRPATINLVAKFVCGDTPLPFPYRTAAEIQNFFRGFGHKCPQEGQSRNLTAQQMLISINLASSIESDMPSPDMTAIIEELMNSVYFEESRDAKAMYREALDKLNGILIQDLLVMTQSHLGGSAKLQKLNSSYISSAQPELEAFRKITFCPSVFKVPTKDAVQDLAAVMMPFAAHFSPVYASIRGACQWASLRCERADEIWNSSAVIQDIFELIFISRIVIVDFSERNPNVMYETGIAHTLGKHVVPITQSMDDVPFDLKQHRVLKYLPNKEGLARLREELSRRLITICKEF
ncbi:hypothetical protein SAMN05444166_0454 [Singulisphaera sp. GP187]|uniref:hypothetical protein n=1 Tax=Singulisphaera sp. GP187 TaxID=1882752 RepID=UPI000929B126|nr:hypothetical protein [Singulisphaera sp. GP187]SIN72529.1 hypothetical protein SAMN05444166_0454 [Singulisphaera sp. GP187]